MFFSEGYLRVNIYDETNGNCGQASLIFPSISGEDIFLEGTASWNVNC